MVEVVSLAVIEIQINQTPFFFFFFLILFIYV